ncbi:hypothetical protein Bca4012_010309 [Brassica carinata]
MALDTASKGNFNTRNPEEAVRLIENFRKQVNFAEDVEAIGTDEEGYEEEVNFIGGSRRFGNQSGNRNFYGNSQRSNYNQNSQYQKPFSNSNYNNNKNLNNSFYQNPPPSTQESKIEAMLDSVLEGQQRLTVDFNGKIDAAYNSLNVKFDTLSTHVKKLETQVIQTA